MFDLVGFGFAAAVEFLRELLGSTISLTREYFRTKLNSASSNK